MPKEYLQYTVYLPTSTKSLKTLNKVAFALRSVKSLNSSMTEILQQNNFPSVFIIEHYVLKTVYSISYTTLIAFKVIQWEFP